MVKLPSLILFLSLVILYGCSNHSEKDTKKPTPDRISFDAVKGIRYYEVKRRFSTGLSFNEIGFQQEPSWIIEFKSNDTVLAYSPQKKVMQPFYLQFDHGNVYNFAKEWFRIKKVTKDSLTIQRLNLVKKEISKDIRSDVNSTYYSKEYIEKTLKTTPEALQKPTKADTLYIKKLTAASNADPGNPKIAFAGRQPVRFTSLSDMIRVEKISTVDVLVGRTVSYDYLFPNYKIYINRAYRDFAYEFSVVVDAEKKIHLTTFGNAEDAAGRKKTLEAIISVYLQNLLKITPGTTLDIPHSSEIKLIVVGRKNG
ncbi:hypothetical protein [Pedobacter metabolipauper]|uniref:Lipoprotein n=1 Tax=Pedobacter metabolipauper TaxID=425513 RepID=A0A4R6SYK1_9SPHI|nr:hypothetical protein [Pedobacter metabolipauper]TDQ09575.1 hypothetical protein ATK78_1731 [Pedobacter metabolipauper]